jgi:hypothetical protein
MYNLYTDLRMAVESNVVGFAVSAGWLLIRGEFLN